MRLLISISFVFFSAFCYGQELKLNQLEKAPASDMHIVPGADSFPVWGYDTIIKIRNFSIREFNGRGQYQDQDSVWKYFGSGNNVVDLSDYYNKSASDLRFYPLSSNPANYFKGTPLYKLPFNGNIQTYLAGDTTLHSASDLFGYTPVPPARTITINGTTYDLSANRSWTVTAGGNYRLPYNASVNSYLAGDSTLHNNSDLFGYTPEPAITSAATTTYFRGDKTFQTLNTSVVPEGANQYFTSSRAQQAIAGIGSGLIRSNGTTLTTDNTSYQPAGSYEVTTNKATSLASPNNTTYPTTQAVASALADSMAKVTYNTSFRYDNSTSAPVNSITVAAIVGKRIDYVVNGHYFIPVIYSGTPSADEVKIDTATGIITYGTAIAPNSFSVIGFRNASTTTGGGSGGDAMTVGGYSATQLRDRSNHIGTQAYTTISNFSTGVTATGDTRYLLLPTINVASTSMTLAYNSDNFFTGSSTVLWTLPTVSSSSRGLGNHIYVKNRGTVAITISGTIYNTSAVSSYTLLAGESITLTPDGTYFNL